MFDEDTIETGIREAADQQGTGSQLTPRKVILAAAATEFISAVVPWPSHGVGHINLHYSMVNPRADEAGQEPMLKGMGWPFKDPSAFVQRAAWIGTTNNFKDVWFCTSRQKEASLNTKNKPKALRRHANAMDLKAIWIDADVKPDETTGKHYTSMQEAWGAISAFRTKVGLPMFSAVVNSGGGLHIYWISDQPLTPAQWLQYAAGLKALLLKEGVKCDAGLTTDDVRLLRVPGTLNHKYDPPREVELLPLPLAKYNFETTLAFLKTIAPAVVTAAAATSVVYFDPAKFKGVKPISVGASPYDTLGAGIEKREEILLDPRPVFTHCAFMRHALHKGGADYDNPLWNLSVLATTFMENGYAIAHQISEKHEDYTPDSTQALYDRKVADRAERGIGYPSCAAIAGNGCKLCRTCPLLGKVKSPLNIGPVVTVKVNDTGSSSSLFGQAPGSASEITVNYVPGNEIACRMALDNVVAADLSTFTSGDILTILRVPDQEKPGLERWGGDLPGTTPALPADIIERAERLKWMAPSGGRASSGGKAPSEAKGDEQRWKRCKPPRDFCTDYITQRRGRYAARLLVGIARVPFMRDDGTLRVEPGYDPETGIFVDRAPKLIVPDDPTLDDAKAALQRVLKPYEYYLFEDPGNGPLQVLAANLTALQRPYMKTAPMFVVNGVQAGTGKGQICRAIGHLVLGTMPPFMSWGHDDDEFKKRFDTMLLASPAMLVMDNCNGRVLRGDTLEMILSEGEATIRQFGKLTGITVRSRTFLMANGNNIQISGDMSRRGIKINILPCSASPESDVFPFTPEGYVIQHRDALLSDYYTIMRAYRLAAMPRSGLPAVGSFSEWERKVRDLIFWLTGHDLSGDFKKNKLDDPEQQEDAAVLSALHAFFGEEWFKASEADAALKRAAERRRLGVSVAFHPGPKTTAAMTQNKVPTIDQLIQAMNDGTAPLALDVLQEIKEIREQEARMKMEAALLEATEQKFGAKLDYAKTLGTWARGIQKKFVDGLILHRREDPHTKIHQIKVGIAISTAEE